jgi:hypothetical protein
VLGEFAVEFGEQSHAVGELELGAGRGERGVLRRQRAVDDEARARQRLEHRRERGIAHPVVRPGEPAAQKQTESRLDIRIVNPCPDEVAKLEAAGLGIVDVDPTRAFAKGVGPSVLKGVPILFGFNARLDIPEDAIYKVISTFHAEKDNLAKADPGFTPMARDFIGMQVQGINANPDVAVHPGLARFLNEHGAWNERWKVAVTGN